MAMNVTLTLSQAKRQFDAALNAVGDELRRISKLDTNHQIHDNEHWQDLYYAQPNVTQMSGYLAKAERLCKALPFHTNNVVQLVTLVSNAAVAVIAAKAAECADNQAKKDARAAKAAYKGDQNLIAAMAGPRGEYKIRCIQHLNEIVAEITAKLEPHGFDIEKAFPYPEVNVSRSFAVRAHEARRLAEKFFKIVSSHRVPNSTRMATRGTPVTIVAIRDDLAEVIDVAADRMVADYFDGYTFKLSKKIGKPIKTADLKGSLWTNCTLTIECEDGDKQVWHTHCIFNRSCLGKVFNQWPTRKVE